MKLANKTFVLSVTLILIIGLAGIFGLSYFLNSERPKGISLGPVTSAPASLTLELNSPDDDLLVFNSSIVVSGKTLAKLPVLVTSESEDLVIESRADGSFSTDFTLTPGVNEITVATFEDGQQRELKRTVFYSKEKI
jgi:hypothetical protein